MNTAASTRNSLMEYFSSSTLLASLICFNGCGQIDFAFELSPRRNVSKPQRCGTAVAAPSTDAVSCFYFSVILIERSTDDILLELTTRRSHHHSSIGNLASTVRNLFLPHFKILKWVNSLRAGFDWRAGLRSWRLYPLMPRMTICHPSRRLTTYLKSQTRTRGLFSDFPTIPLRLSKTPARQEICRARLKRSNLSFATAKMPGIYRGVSIWQSDLVTLPWFACFCPKVSRSVHTLLDWLSNT